MKNYIQINLAIYRMSIIVSWEKDIVKTLKWANLRGCTITEEEMKRMREITEEKLTLGAMFHLGENNVDLLVWLREKPITLKQYGVLYHELHHAIFAIGKDKSMPEEDEALAYLYEYSLLECMKVFNTAPPRKR